MLRTAINTTFARMVHGNRRPAQQANSLTQHVKSVWRTQIMCAHNVITTMAQLPKPQRHPPNPASAKSPIYPTRLITVGLTTPASVANGKRNPAPSTPISIQNLAFADRIATISAPRTRARARRSRKLCVADAVLSRRNSSPTVAPATLPKAA